MSDNMAKAAFPEERGRPVLTIKWKPDESEHHPVIEIEIPFILFWPVYQVGHQTGVREAKVIAALGAAVVLEFTELLPNSEPSTVLESAIQFFDELFDKLFAFGIPEWKHKDDPILSFTYALLYHYPDDVTWEAAAKYATVLLGRQDDPITETAWRLRVTRWAERHHLPKIEKYQRSKPEGQDNNHWGVV